jgi:hypothetical protein
MENSIRLDLKKMLKPDYTYCTDYDYNTEYSCDTSGCYDEGICRCGRIENAVVKSVNLSSLTEEIYSQLMPENKKSRKRESRISEILYGGSIVDKYCIYRILVVNRVFLTDCWEVNTTSSYYGDEVDSVTIEPSTLNKINSQCEKLFSLETLSDKLKYVLELEYGYVLDDVKDCEFELVSIYKNHIDFKKLSQNHIRNVKMEDLSHYSISNYYLPRGIVRGEIDNYKIVDGFHRIIASNDKKSFGVFRVIKN